MRLWQWGPGSNDGTAGRICSHTISSQAVTDRTCSIVTLDHAMFVMIHTYTYVHTHVHIHHTHTSATHPHTHSTHTYALKHRDMYTHTYIHTYIHVHSTYSYTSCLVLSCLVLLNCCRQTATEAPKRAAKKQKTQSSAITL